jgi:hypothetical protein
MKLPVIQVVSTYLLLQAAQTTALPVEDPDPTTVSVIVVETPLPPVIEIQADTPAGKDGEIILELPGNETPSEESAEPSEPEPVPTETPNLSVFGQMYAGKPTWECWYEKRVLMNSYHLHGYNWNATEEAVKKASKKSDALTGWQWEERKNTAGAQTFRAEVRFVLVFVPIIIIIILFLLSIDRLCGKKNLAKFCCENSSTYPSRPPTVSRRT